ncbi:hypothetical protein K0M31_006941 [Melipona bicolor]|uniref:Uncharacterized protein n=1 Tax=Melipona bicolor TaxID=60889 RepID=A0AA40KKR6_9HYME|nr:hypothetical protein K0M31_006941 [Melipona bicolor]
MMEEDAVRRDDKSEKDKLLLKLRQYVASDPNFPRIMLPFDFCLEQKSFLRYTKKHQKPVDDIFGTLDPSLTINGLTKATISTCATEITSIPRVGRACSQQFNS